MISWFISGQQSSSGQHQELRLLVCIGTVHVNRQKQAIMNSAGTTVRRAEMKRRELDVMNQSFWPLQSSVGSVFNLQQGVLAITDDGEGPTRTSYRKERTSRTIVLRTCAFGILVRFLAVLCKTTWKTKFYVFWSTRTALANFSCLPLE